MLKYAYNDPKLLFERDWITGYMTLSSLKSLKLKFIFMFKWYCASEPQNHTNHLARLSDNIFAADIPPPPL
jgi:hypothetical protein